MVEIYKRGLKIREVGPFLRTKFWTGSHKFASAWNISMIEKLYIETWKVRTFSWPSEVSWRLAISVSPRCWTRHYRKLEPALEHPIIYPRKSYNHSLIRSVQMCGRWVSCFMRWQLWSHPSMHQVSICSQWKSSAEPSRLSLQISVKDSET